MSSNPNRGLPAFAVPVESLSESATRVAPEARPRHLELLPSAPIARTIARVSTVHGETRVDEYSWLRDREDPETLAYLQAENRYTQAVMRHTEELQEQLCQELRGRIKETDLSVPEQVDDWLYYARTEAGGLHIS